MKYDARWVEGLRTNLILGLRLFYAGITVEGQEHVPKEGPVILASNHNNAVLDALILGFFSGGRRPGFLTRADVFKRPLLRKFFTALRMIPVYRVRDNVDIKTANNATFDQVAQWLAKGQSAIIFPEGDKGHDFHLLPLKKGTARMAFHALPDLTQDLYIVPAGITYEQLHTVRKRVIIRYGEPIRVHDYWAAYQQHPDLTLKALTNDLQAAIERLMWHVPSADVPLIRWWVDSQRSGAYRDRVAKAFHWWHAMAEEERLAWRERIAQWRIANVYPTAVGRSFPVGALVAALLLGPLVLEGLLWLVLPFFVPSWLAERMSGHPHFHTSIRFGLLWLCFPLFSLLQGGLLFWLLPGPWSWLAIAVVFLLPVLTWQWFRAIRSLQWWAAWQRVPSSVRADVEAVQATLS